MISIGGHYNGPELKGSPIERLLSGAMCAIADVRGPWIGDDDFGPGDPRPAQGPYFETGAAPAVNVIFYVPGSLGYDGPSQIEAARYSRKKKLLLVAVPVPQEVAEAGGSIEFVIDALRQANRIAEDVFAKKGPEPFDLAKADAIVEEVRRRLETGAT